MRTIKLHHHDQEDHIVDVARGRGILGMGEKGQENREVTPGDLINLPRGGAYALLLLAPDPWSLWGFAAIAGF